MNLSIDEWSKFKVSDIFEPFINGKGLTSVARFILLKRFMISLCFKKYFFIN